MKSSRVGAIFEAACARTQKGRESGQRRFGCRQGRQVSMAYRERALHDEVVVGPQALLVADAHAIRELLGGVSHHRLEHVGDQRKRTARGGERSVGRAGTGGRGRAGIRVVQLAPLQPQQSEPGAALLGALLDVAASSRDLAVDHLLQCLGAVGHVLLDLACVAGDVALHHAHAFELVKDVGDGERGVDEGLARHALVRDLKRRPLGHRVLEIERHS